MNSYDIKDLSLASEGIKKIDFVSKNMPLMNGILKEYSKKKIFKGKRISMCMHLEAKTGYLAKVIKELGGDLAVCGSNTLSTKDDIAAGLVKLGIKTYAIHGSNKAVYEKHLLTVADHKPHIIIDDGSDLIFTLIKKRPSLAKNVLGGAEETTTGILRLKAMEKAGVLPFPMMAANDAKCKFMFDNRYGTGQSTLEAIMHNTNLIIASKTVVVVGYGWCGKGIALRAKSMGANVIVCEIDPVKALEARMDSFSVMKMSEAAKYGDFFISATGCNKTITPKIAMNMKSGSVLANAGHFDVEIDMHGFKKEAKKIFNARENIDTYVLKNNKEINIIAEGKLVNIAASFGHPAEIMDMSFAVQFYSVKHILDNSKKLEKKVYNLSAELDNLIAKRKLTSLGSSLDTLTNEQKKYLEAWEF